MKFRELGNTGEKLSAIGLGCMGMSYAYGPKDDKESIRTLHRALELEINFWDTADRYGYGHNEELISNVLVPNRQKIFIATKFGFRERDSAEAHTVTYNTYIDGSPAYVKTAAENSLKRLKTDVIDLYYLHRIDPNVPIEDTVGAMSQLVSEGKVRYLGLSEASAGTIRRAHKVHKIAALETEYSILTRDAEGEILDTCRELGIAFIPFSPLSRGLVTGTIENPENFAADDYRRVLPRFSGSHFDNNRKLAAEFAAIAGSRNLTPAQLALAWVLAQGKDIIPIPGTKRVKYLEENAAAVEAVLNQEDMDNISSLLKKYPDVGPRYDQLSMSVVNK
ncbi:MAG: aldo/keto reductase [Bacteroidota bacterium]